jgi:hypothetical protein
VSRVPGRFVRILATTYVIEQGLLPVILVLSSSQDCLLSIHITSASGQEKHHIDVENLPASLPLRLQEYLAPDDILMFFIGDRFGEMDCLYAQVEKETGKLVMRAVENEELDVQFQFEVREEQDSSSLFSRLRVPWLAEEEHVADGGSEL